MNFIDGLVTISKLSNHKVRDLYSIISFFFLTQSEARIKRTTLNKQLTKKVSRQDKVGVKEPATQMFSNQVYYQ
jgi:hypothetical protein